MTNSGLCAVLTLALMCISQACAERIIEIEKAAERLRVKDGEKVLAEFSCSLGKGGPQAKSKKGDNRTPEGEYRIVRINKGSGFHIFLHLSYPNRIDIEKARASGAISDSLYQKMKSEIEKGSLPPQNTILGGDVGIHGIRNGMGWVGRLHRMFNWTQGCIAVTNQEIEKIAALVKVGTTVVILP